MFTFHCCGYKIKAGFKPYETREIMKDNSCIFTIFGATGDLTKRKLIPALYMLYKQKRLPEGCSVVAIGRRKKTSAGYIEEMKNFMVDELQRIVDPNTWAEFSSLITYHEMSFTDDEGYVTLKNLFERVGKSSNRIYYLAVAPEFFEVIVEKLHEHSMIENKDSWQRVIIEKPFGSNLKTARKLNESITNVIHEDKIFRIDHYLGKEMLQNILSIRFGNSIFEPLWNHNYIDHVQIISTETLGVGTRGAYYDSIGIIRDMLQNHILQMLTLIAMEPPVNLEAESIRDEKVKVLQALRQFEKTNISETFISGQYGPGNGMLGYRQEDNVDPESNTDTFIAVKTFIDNFRWGGVPFYICAGKRMSEKTTKIIIRFKKLPGINFYEGYENTEANVLVIRVQPDEGLFFRINAKNPGNDFAINSVDLDYCQDCSYKGNSPEAYERLILEAINDNKSLFTRWDELEYSWKFIDSLCEARTGSKLMYPNYKAGGIAPMEAVKLIENDGRKWWKETPNEVL
jgi:glucose-6-phosphate 1-dehydrogenase